MVHPHSSATPRLHSGPQHPRTRVFRKGTVRRSIKPTATRTKKRPKTAVFASLTKIVSFNFLCKSRANLQHTFCIMLVYNALRQISVGFPSRGSRVRVPSIALINNQTFKRLFDGLFFLCLTQKSQIFLFLKHRKTRKTTKTLVANI